MSELNSYKKTVYCGWTKNSEDLCESASGGIFYCLAKKILEEDGYVVGAVYSDDFKSVKHIMSRNIEDIKRMRGSKYSQSNYVDVIDKVEEKCKNGNNVLFSHGKWHLCVVHIFHKYFLINILCIITI